MGAEEEGGWASGGLAPPARGDEEGWVDGGLEEEGPLLGRRENSFCVSDPMEELEGRGEGTGGGLEVVGVVGEEVEWGR